MFDRVGFSLDIRASSVRSMNRGGGGDGERLSLSLVTFADFPFCFPFKSDFDFLHFGALPSDLPPTDQHWAILFAICAKRLLVILRLYIWQCGRSRFQPVIDNHCTFLLLLQCSFMFKNQVDGVLEGEGS